MRRFTSLVLFFLALCTAQLASARSTGPSWAVMIEGPGSCGGGSVVAEDLVLTSLHVVRDLSEIVLLFADGQEATAELLIAEPALDLALLRVPPGVTREIAPLGSALETSVGDTLYTVGCPSGLPWSVSKGVLSYSGRLLRGLRFLQTDVLVHPGNSGGPVFDSAGRLIAVMAQRAKNSTEIGFSLPIEYARERFANYLRPLGRTERAAFEAWKQ